MAGKNAGAVEGSGTRSSLVYEVIRIAKEIQPKYIIWENVKGLLTKKNKPILDDYINKLKDIGYNSYYQLLNAKDYGIPQNRERIFTVSIRTDIDDNGFKFPQKQELKLKLKDFLEQNVDEKYYLKKNMLEYISANNKKWTGNNEKSLINKTIASTINTGEGTRRCDASNYISTNFPENYDLKKSKRIFGIYGSKEGGSVYDPKYISPTLTTKSSLNWNILIKENIPFTKNIKLLKNKNLKIIGKLNIKGNDCIKRVYSVEGLSPTITTCQGGNTQPKILENETNILGTYQFSKSNKFMNGKDKFKSNKEISDTLQTSPKEGIVNLDYKIRKLTPKECWRLMGFDDKSFEKAKLVPTSDCQLYKQAGNSICVPVLMAIFKELFKDYIKEEK